MTFITVNYGMRSSGCLRAGRITQLAVTDEMAAALTATPPSEITKARFPELFRCLRSQARLTGYTLAQINSIRAKGQRGRPRKNWNAGEEVTQDE